MLTMSPVGLGMGWRWEWGWGWVGGAELGWAELLTCSCRRAPPAAEHVTRTFTAPGLMVMPLSAASAT